MRALPLLLVWFVSFAAAGCWSPRAFAPREHVDAHAPDGTPAALYSIPLAPEQPATAEVRVWCSGAEARFTDDDREVVELFVSFELENNGAESLQLDLGSVQCEQLLVDGATRPALAPSTIAGDGSAPPATTARVDLVFEPAVDAPRDIDAFAVRFVVRAGEREVLQQVTPFGPWVRRVAHDPYWDGWGWGFGFGLGSHWHWH